MHRDVSSRSQTRRSVDRPRGVIVLLDRLRRLAGPAVPASDPVPDNLRPPASAGPVVRPWGSFAVLDEGMRFKVKRIVVRPGECLSLQRHFHRAEHWIVVSGTAQVTVGDRVLLVHENESVEIPKSTLHRLENPGKVLLQIIEVQSGEYLGEDDIVREQDVYGRT